MPRRDGAAGPDPLADYRAMLRIRLFEEQAARLYAAGEIPGFVHLSVGQEAVAVGVCGALRSDDVITSTHRGHGHMLAKGADLDAMLAELMGRATGTCGGFGGSMHIADPTIGVYGANGIVGAGIPIAVGAALGARLKTEDRVAVSFFGDGAVATGAFHEAVNLAAVWSLPVLFCCENNGYAEFARTEHQHAAGLEHRAAAYGLPFVRVDGNDVGAVREAAATSIARMRAGSGPIVLEAVTLRVRGHYEGDQQRYRPSDERRAEDPIAVSERRLLAEGRGERELACLRAEAEAEIAGALEAARSAPWPEPERILSLASPRSGVGGTAGVAARPAVPDATTRVSRLVRAAIHDAMADDPRVFLMGVDAGESGNVFGLTRGLADEFPGRLRDTPISETAIVGAAVGAALDGLRPIAELMYLDFLGVCFDQLLNQAAKLRFMTGGAVDVPMVLRTQYGVGRSSGSQHSQSLEALLAHVPGLVVVMPSSPEDHYGLLRAAIESPDTVVVIENRLLYEQRTDVVPTSDYRVELGRARVAREGTDVTLVGASRGVWTLLEAARQLADRGIQAEVIDLRTIAPLDWPTIEASLAKTNRLAVYSEGVTDFGIGAEIVARAADAGFWSLDAPLKRLGGPRAPVPYSPSLESSWLPSADRVIEEIERLCQDAWAARSGR